MKLLLIAYDINQGTIQEMATPFGLLYLASYLGRYFGRELEIRIIDGMTDALKEDADLIGISSMSRYYGMAREFAKKIKERAAIPIILGGHHITGLPSTLGDCFDIGVRGEGEETLLELVKLWQEHKCFRPDVLHRVNGIVFRENGRIITTPPRPPLLSLDDIPFPARSLWDLSGRAKYIISSRGCPFGCVFCATGRSSYRFPSTQYVLEELQMIYREYSPQVIVFQDDLFALNTGRLKEISEGVTRAGLHRKTAFIVSLRADCIDEERLKLLRKMNVFKIFMGIESGSPDMIRYYKAGKISIENVQKALELCMKYDILVEGSFIIGAPRETRDDLLATYNFILDNYKKGNLYSGNINILTPYPGSQVWEYARERGLVNDIMDWSRLNPCINLFDPYTCIHLNELIPLAEFVDYVDFFEDLHFKICKESYKTLEKSYHKLVFESRLNRERLNRYKQENAE